MKNLPGIKAVGLIQRSALPENMVFKAMAGVKIVIDAQPEWLCDARGASGQWESRFDNNSYYERAKLSFNVPAKLDITGKVFIAETVEEELLVFGFREPPHPVVIYTRNSGEPGGTSAGYSYEVSSTASRAVLSAEWA